MAKIEFWKRAAGTVVHIRPRRSTFRERRRSSTSLLLAKRAISLEIEEVFYTKEISELEEIFSPFYSMFDYLDNRSTFQGHFQRKHKELLETFDSEKVSELLKEEN